MNAPQRQEHADPLRTIRSVAVGLVAVEVAVLVATGIWLVFNYRPESANLFRAAGHRYSSGELGWIRETHRYVSMLALLTSLWSGALVLAGALIHWSGRRRLALIVLAALLVLVLGSASFTGYLLPWDQLALRAVTAGTEFKGYTGAFGPKVLFAIVGGSEISQSTLWRWFIVHVVALSLLVILILAAVVKLRPSRKHRRELQEPPQVAG